MYKIARLVMPLLLFLCCGQLAAQTASSEVRDPTRPLGARTTVGETTGEQRLVLNSVLISAQRKVAIINGVALREGQWVPGANGVKVLRISPQAVVVQQASKTWSLRLAPSVVTRH